MTTVPAFAQSTQPPLVWGLVLSRQGSKRLPGKALVPLAGKPLIAHTFDAALAAPSLAKRWVYTNDPQVLTLARKLGMDVPPFERPDHLSADDTDSFATIRQFLSQFPPQQWPDWLMILQPTSPLRRASDIEGALLWFGLHQPCDYLISVHRPLKPPHWTYAMDSRNNLTKAIPAPPLPATPATATEYVFPNGAIYLMRPELLMTGDQSLPPEQRPGVTSKGYEMPWERSLDIDWPVDLALAAWLMAQQQQPYPSVSSPPSDIVAGQPSALPVYLDPF
jgi:CMP-N,N'-diacetyllegionaminic acid synthase